MQGGHQAVGLDTIPDLTVRDWAARRGGSYGYGRACMTIEAGARDRVAQRIGDVRQLPLEVCRSDRKLKPPE